MATPGGSVSRGCAIALAVVSLVTVVIVVGAALVLHGRWVFASGYTDGRFARIASGMRRAEVVRTLGRPLSVDRSEERLYSVRVESQAVVPVIIRFDNSGQVSLDSPPSEIARKRGIAVGTARSDVEAALHTRVSKHVRFLYYWHYAEARGMSWSNHTRDVVFDQAGRVVQTHRIEFDD